MGQGRGFCQNFKSMRKHLLMCDEYAGQLGSVSAPAQVLKAVNARVWDSLARSFPQRGNCHCEEPCDEAIFTGSPRRYAPRDARSVVHGLPHPHPSPLSPKKLGALEDHFVKAEPSRSLLHSQVVHHLDGEAPNGIFQTKRYRGYPASMTGTVDFDAPPHAVKPITRDDLMERSSWHSGVDLHQAGAGPGE